MTSANTVKQIPFSPDLSVGGLTSQESGIGLLNANNTLVSSGPYVSQSQTPVTMTRNSVGVTQNPVNGDLTLAAVDGPAFGDIGIQIGRQKDNELTNSDARSGVTGYTLTDVGGIVVTFATQASGIDESDQAIRLRMVNTSGGPQFVELHQSISGGLINEYWTAQASIKALEVIGISTIGLIRVVDFSNSQISSNSFLENFDVFERVGVTHQLTAASADFRWNIQFSVPDTETLDVLITNNSLVNSSWNTHYVPSTTGPTTRESDVVDVGATDDPFFTHLVDEMWSIDFKTLGVLTTISGGESQLQYLFSSFNGVNGTNLFVDDVNTITWQADFNGSLEDVTLVVTGLGAVPHRVYMRTLDDLAGGFDRQLFVENLVTGAISASTVLNTTNLPIQGDIMKIGRDDSDANILDGFIGRLTFWGNRFNLSMNRINDNWPTP